jgi:transposase-like protein
MAPTTAFCLKLACPARGQTGQGHIGSHSRQDKRFIGQPCHKTFTVTTGTVFYRRRTAAETGVMVVTWHAHGCPP